MTKMKLITGVLLLGLMSHENANAISPPVTSYGPNGTGFVTLPSIEQGKAGNLIELADGSQIALSVDYPIRPYTGTRILLHKLTPKGLPDTNWQPGGIRPLPVVDSNRLSLQYYVKPTLLQAPTGYLAVSPMQAGVGGIWIQAVDKFGNDANIFGGFAFKYVAVSGLAQALFIESFSVLSDPKRSRFLVLGNYYTSAGSTNFVGAIGFNGVVDSSFGNQGFVLENETPNLASYWRDIAVSNDAIYIVGDQMDLSANSGDYSLTKLSLSGVPDPVYGVAGTKRYGRVGYERHAQVVVSPAGILLVGGRDPNLQIENAQSPNCCVAALYPQTAVARVLPNGDLDSSFGNGGWVDIQNSEYMGITDVAMRAGRLGAYHYARLVFSAVGELSANAGIAGNIEVGPSRFGNDSAAITTTIGISECGPFGQEWPVQIELGASNAVYITGTNGCRGTFPGPVVSKHLAD